MGYFPAENLDAKPVRPKNSMTKDDLSSIYHDETAIQMQGQACLSDVIASPSHGGVLAKQSR